MPIHIEPDKLRIAYVTVNIFASIYFFAPLGSAIYLYGAAIYGSYYMLFHGLMGIAFFILFAKAIFLAHQRIHYLFEGMYYEPDKKKLQTLFNFPPEFCNKVYGKLPLPLIQIRKRGSITK